MLKLVTRFLDWIKSLFWKEEMELTLVGLQFSGKTTFVSVIAVSRVLVLTSFAHCSKSMEFLVITNHSSCNWKVDKVKCWPSSVLRT